VSGLSRRSLLANGGLIVAFSLSRRVVGQERGEKTALPGNLDKSPLLDPDRRDPDTSPCSPARRSSARLKTALIQIAADEPRSRRAEHRFVTADTGRTPDEA
jgi:hypothetical protein